mgnify:FL=1
MKRIAVCISGLIRYWEETYPLFEYWNEMFDDVEFTFFLSTWEGNTWYDKEKFPNITLTDYDFSKYDFIEDYSLHNQSEVDISKSSGLPNGILRAYLWNKVNILRKNYEDTNDVKFDSVMLIRNDMFVNKDILKYSSLVSNLKQWNDYHFVFTMGGAQTYYEQSKNPVLFIGNDNWYCSSSKTMDLIMNLYDWIITDKLTSKSCYKSPAEFFIKNNIHNFTLGSAPIKLYREEPIIKSGNPTPQVMKKLIDEKGVKWIYDVGYGDLTSIYWNYEK